MKLLTIYSTINVLYVAVIQYKCIIYDCYGACGRKTYMGNVIPLCKKHHDLVHTNKKKYQPMLIEMCNNKLKENGFKEVNL